MPENKLDFFKDRKLCTVILPVSPSVPPLPPPVTLPVDIAALNVNMPPAIPSASVTTTRDREAPLLRRIRELEDELRGVRAENEKQVRVAWHHDCPLIPSSLISCGLQKAMIVKFRERWEKLKESAKRKKQAKAAAEATSVVGDRIEEEPEAEAEAEKNDSSSRAQSTSDSLIGA